MQHRGTSHVLFTDLEIMKRIRRRDSVDVLRQLMELYEIRTRRQSFKEVGASMEGILAIEMSEFTKLMDLTGQWLRQPLSLDFGGHEPNLTKAERRRRRKQRRSHENQ